MSYYGDPERRRTGPVTKLRITIDDIPELPGYMTLAAIAAKYKVDKGTVRYMILAQNAFKTVCKVTKGGLQEDDKDKRPLLLISSAEVEEVFAERKKLNDQLKQQRLLNPGRSEDVIAWNRRVKEWGRSIGWTQTPISIAGPPNQTLIVAYVKRHPDDVRPAKPAAE